jgi:hypothetical protein
MVRELRTMFFLLITQDVCETEAEIYSFIIAALPTWLQSF